MFFCRPPEPRAGPATELSSAIALWKAPDHYPPGRTKAPKKPQEAPQMPPKKPQEAPKRLPRGLKTASRGPREPSEETPRSIQEPHEASGELFGASSPNLPEHLRLPPLSWGYSSRVGGTGRKAFAI